MPGRHSRGGRRPQPDALKDLRGRPSKDKPRNLIRPEVFGGEAPDWLPPLAVEFWRDHAPSFRRLGLLTEISVPAWALLCHAWSDFRELAEDVRVNGRIYEKTNWKGEAVGPAARAEVAQLRDAFDRFRAMAAEFGVGPASLARISTGATAPPEDEVAAYRAQRKGAA